jgi:3-methyladenine DNA glycosylase AlkD
MAQTLKKAVLLEGEDLSIETGASLMNKAQVLKELKSLGTAQNRKVYGSHGVAGDLYGVSYANLGELTKKIKTDHALAEQLWDSGNHDARVLATMIADPSRITARQLDTWVKDLENYVLTDAFTALAAKAPLARKRMEKWIAARGEWISSAGWQILSRLAQSEDAPTDAFLEKSLSTIEAKIHSSKNRTRYAMNSALIAIGIRNPSLQKKAIEAARRIGKVQVDHGETGCKTPDAEAYIKKTFAHRRTRKKRRTSG